MRKFSAALFAASLSVCTLASQAEAADLGGAPRRSIKDGPAPYTPVFSWTGIYVGVHGGYAWTDVDWQYAATPAVSTGHTGDGWLLGGQIGYNVQIRQFVFGLEGDFSGAWVDGDTACPNAGFSCGHSVNWISSLRGRAGVTFNDNRTLFYGTAGGAWADVDYTASNGVTSLKISDRSFGWVAGLGLEHMLTHNLSARVEYLYYAFDDVSAPAGTLGGGPASLDPSMQTVRFGLNWKF